MKQALIPIYTFEELPEEGKEGVMIKIAEDDSYNPSNSNFDASMFKTYDEQISYRRKSSLERCIFLNRHRERLSEYFEGYLFFVTGEEFSLPKSVTYRITERDV